MTSRFLPATRASAFDLIVVLALVLGGAAYHWDFAHWAAGLIGGEPYGDAHFWWDGAVRISDGQFTNHPGKGYRPGYFVLSGLSLPVIGADGPTFHKFLLVNFLAAASFLYFALRQPLGRAAAAASAALLVFNPYTAEWIATTTTDGLGLVLHLAALGCLLAAVQRDLSLRWLCGFGVLFAVGNLTRPLVLPYVGVVVLLLLTYPRPWRARLLATLTTVVAFAVPTVLWMAVQARWVGEWTVSNNDAGALYAASDPKLQVWTPTMYDEILVKAKKRYKTETPTQAQINQEFKRQALNNYYRHRRFHAERALPHVWTVASFSPQLSRHGSIVPRTWILSALAATLALLMLSRGLLLRATLLALLGGAVWLSPQLVALLTLGGCALALMPRPGRAAHLGLLLIAAYWLVGVLALFLTGGTWIHNGATHLNALGVRIGSQFFFSGDVLACALLFRMTRLNLPAEASLKGAAARARAWVARILAGRLAPAAAVTGALFVLLLLADATVLAVGAGKVAVRRYSLVRGRKTPFPDATRVTELYRQNTHPDALGEMVQADRSNFVALLRPNPTQRREGPDVLVTGTTGSAVWEMTGQQRTVVFFHPQQHARNGVIPGDFEQIEFPFAGQSGKWHHRRGAFILRGAVDRPPAHNLPNYLQFSSVRAFVPLAPDGTSYAMDEAVWFPLTRYASQLEAAGNLAWLPKTTVNYLPDSGPAPFQRRVKVVPAKPTEQDSCGFVIRLDRALGKRTLRLGWHPVEESNLSSGHVTPWTIQASRSDFSSPTKLLPTIRTDNGFPYFEIDCSSPELAELELTFHDVPAGVVLYELNLTADDFRP